MIQFSKEKEAVDMADWDRLSEGRSPRKYRAGQMVYLQGTPPDCFYYLASGSVRSFIKIGRAHV